MIQYDPHRWADHLFDVRGSLIAEITPRVLAFVGWSVIVVILGRYFPLIAIPATVHTLVGAAVGLLLVFRTNSSYQRFWEGRGLWGSLLNESRNLARGVSVHLKKDPALLDTTIRWVVAYSYSVKNLLRGTEGLGPVAAELPPAEVEWALNSEHPTLAVAARITSRLVKARDRGLISDVTLASLDRNVHLMVGYLGGCERIHTTPLPFAYMVHLRRVIILYCGTLPFALVESFGWLTVPATLGVAYTFLGIEEIGVEIENPFGHDVNDLALEDLCTKVAKNLLALTGRHEEVEALETDVSEVLKIGVQ